MGGIASRSCARWALGIIALSLVAMLSAAQSSNQRKSKQPPALESAVAHLIDEAKFAIREGKLHYQKADYATRFPAEIPLRDLTEAIAAPVDPESFIDGYVRWQLTSFKPSLPDLDDRQFLTLIGNAPALVANPKADPAFITTFEQAQAAPSLSQQQIVELRLAKVELERRIALADSFNVPAREYRKWLADQFPASRVRQHCLVIEECAATTKASWPPRAIKSKLTKLMKQAGDDSSITQAQRQFIAQQLQPLASIKKRRAINEITFPRKGGVEVTFTNVHIDQDDVDKWIAQLNGDAP
jgi:hypothetical protein